MNRQTRRTVLKLLGGAATATGGIGTAGARGDVHSLRLVGQESIPGSMEAVAQEEHVYVATGTGMAVVNWRNPGQPETVAEVDLAADLETDGDDPDDEPTPDVLDVKVDGDVAVLANDEEDPGGIALYDVSDPTNPTFRSFYAPEPPSNIHNCHVDGDYAYLALSEPWNIQADDDPERDLVRLFGDSGVEIVDISDPSAPSHAATWLLKDELSAYAKGGVCPCHDVYAQDGLVYGAFWDAGTIVLDAAEPTDPRFVTQFGSAPDADDEIRPWRVEEESIGEYFREVFPLARYLGLPGNAHYVQPSPDGDHVFVGAETFLGGPGGIEVWDVADLDAPANVGRVDPPDVDGFRTAHNFDVTENRLHASWYRGGVRVYDVTDPSNPTELAEYNPDGVAFWTAVAERGFTVGGVYGAMSEEGGITVLHDDLGAKRPPAFSGAEPPDGPEVDPRDQS